jgi:hypothetical protein
VTVNVNSTGVGGFSQITVISIREPIKDMLLIVGGVSLAFILTYCIILSEEK